MSPLRTFRRDRAYVLASVVTLALATASNVVVFSFVSALWLRSPQVREPDRLVVVGRDFGVGDGSRYSDTALESISRNDAFENVAGQVVTSGLFAGIQPRMVLADLGQPVETLWVTPEYFPVLGVEIVGPGFRRGDGDRGGVAPAVISDRLWRTALGARPDVVGLELAATPVNLEVVGVAPAGFNGARRGERVDLWLPHRLLPRLTGSQLADLRQVVLPMLAFARLRPGVSLEAAAATLAQGPRPAVLAPLTEMFGASDVPMVRTAGGGLMAMNALTAGLVLMAGCAALMALSLAHYERRGRELAVRVSMGATRSRLIRQLGVEIAGIACAAAIVALGLSTSALGLLPQFTLPGGIDLGRLQVIVDWRAASLAFGCCVVSLCLAAAWPIARATRATVGLALVATSGAPSRASARARRVILAVHVAITTVVLVAAALCVERVRAAFDVGPGFETSRVVFANVQTRSPFVTLESRQLAVRIAADTAAALEVVNRIRGLAGVEIIALGGPPLGRSHEEALARLRTLETEGGKYDVPFAWLPASDDYLPALGVRLLGGRVAERGEAVVTHSLAEALWPGESPLGKWLRHGSIRMTVVGTADFAAGSMRLGRAFAVVFGAGPSVSDVIERNGLLTLAIRAHAADAVRAPVARLLRQAFPSATQLEVTTAQELLVSDLGQERMGAWLFSGFGVATLTLAVIGVFSLVAHLIQSRWTEFAVRMALGASAGDVARRVLWGTLSPAAIGAATGVLASALFVGALDTQVFGVRHFTLMTPVAPSLILMACAALAAGTACVRIRRVSPGDLLRPR